MSHRRCLPLAALAALLLLSSCYTVPVTGRHAMNMVDDKEVTAMSISMFDDMKHQYRVSRDRKLNDQLQRVGEKISQIVYWQMPDADWEFVVFDNEEINAFAMAGGKVGVFTGLFKIVKTDDQLAAVISHEIAHVTAKHIHEKLSQDMAVQTVGTVGLLGAGLGGVGQLTTAALGSAYGLTTGVGGAVFDRAKESEADHIGLIYMARAGYNPEEALTVLENLQVESADTVASSTSLMSTHPATSDRIEALRKAMPEALKAREEAAKDSAIKVLK